MDEMPLRIGNLTMMTHAIQLHRHEFLIRGMHEIGSGHEEGARRASWPQPRESRTATPVTNIDRHLSPPHPTSTMTLTLNTQMKTTLSSIALALLTPMAALANDAHHKPPAAAAAAGITAGAVDMTDAEVRKIDMEGGKITLKHADIKSLDMPAMTMVFVVKDKAMLDKLKTGDKVRFKAINDAGKFTVTEIEPAK